MKIKTKIHIRDYQNPYFPPLMQDILARLRKHLCWVKFIKADGTVRNMLCSLNETFLPPPKDTAKDSKPSISTVTVWDVELNEWRAFKLETFIKLAIVLPD
jgi:hypothetical protein